MLEADDIRPLGTRIIVRHYERPEETPGGIVIPPSYQEDTGGELWEAVKWSDEAERYVGLKYAMNLHEGMILRTKPLEPIEIEDSNGLWIVSAEKIIGAIPWKEADDDDDRDAK